MIVIQHEPGEGPGTLAPFLRDARLVRTFAGDPVPGEADALVVLGGGMGVYEQDRLPHLADEIRLLRWCLEKERPVLGMCLGSPLLAAGAGGRLVLGGSREFRRLPLARRRLHAPARRGPARFQHAHPAAGVSLRLARLGTAIPSGGGRGGARLDDVRRGGAARGRSGPRAPARGGGGGAASSARARGGCA